MNKLKVLHMYSDMLDLYGDSGNMEILKYRCKMRGIECEIEKYSINSEMPDFSSFDLIYLGGGADLEQQHISADLHKCRKGIADAYKKGTFLFLICGGYQLFGKYYKDADGNKMDGLGLFDYYTVAEPDRRKRCIGNVIIRTEFTGKTVDIVGFENHGGQTKGVKNPLGSVVCGHGNCTKSTHEGYVEKNVIATYMHGPCLAKNPEVSDYIIAYCLGRQTGKAVRLPVLDDSLEKKCRQIMIDRLTKK